MEIKDAEVYRLSEAKEYLKVSTSTILRMVKRGVIRTAKIGRQHRIPGRELLRVVNLIEEKEDASSKE